MVSSITATDQHPVGFAFQTKMFFAQNRWWLFYSNGTNMCYATNKDRACTNTSFETPVIIQTGGSNIACTRGTEFCVVTDGTFVHYGRVLQDSIYLYYRRGRLNGDGTITWDSNEILVYTSAGNDMRMSSIILDSFGHPLIAVHYQAKCHVFRNENSDGTWSTDDAYVSGIVVNGSNADSVLFRPALVALSDGKWAVVFGGVTGGHLYINWWNGISLQYSTSQAPLQFTDVVASYITRFSLTADENDNVYLAWIGSTSPYRLYFRKWVFGETSLSNSTIIVQNVSGQNSPPYYCVPMVRYDTDSRELAYMFFGYPDSGSVYCRTSIDYGTTWSPTTTTAPTTIQSGLTIQTGQEGWTMNVVPFNGDLIAVFVSGSGSPYTIQCPKATSTRNGPAYSFNQKEVPWSAPCGNGDCFI